MVPRSQLGVSNNESDCPIFPKRADIRNSSDVSGKTGYKHVALMGAFALLMAGPVLGSTSAAASNSNSNTPIGHYDLANNASEESWSNIQFLGAGKAGDLTENPGAASRARLREPAAVRACVAAQGAANGSRTLTERQVVYHPMVEGSYIKTSGFGGRIDPVTGAWSMHNGEDYAAPAGTPILAVADGVVHTVGVAAGLGYYIKILHDLEDGSSVISVYGHQLAGSQLVSEGQTVKAGQQIAGVGNTGKSTGPHLHFEINNLEGVAVAPNAWLEAQGAIFVGSDC